MVVVRKRGGREGGRDEEEAEEEDAVDLDRLPTDSPPPRSLSVLTYVPWLLMCVVLLASWVGAGVVGVVLCWIR